MNLSWNEIRSRAVAFSHEWATERSEDAEAKSFWDAFFDVFGLTRRRLAKFEVDVRKLDGTHGYIDLFWAGKLLVEHKSRGKSLDSAFAQGLSYFEGLTEAELPRYILVSDFARIRLVDLEATDPAARVAEFPLSDLPANIQRFGFIAGFETRVFKDQDPVNNLAAERLGKLHDYLEKQRYTGHQLEVFMVRVLFCLFAEDTGIYNRFQFEEYLSNHTAPDGGDLGARLNELFSTLDKAEADRQLNLDPDLAAFPYVNGSLFAERIDPPTFDREGRDTVLFCAAFDWSKISPAIFGSLFQSVMNPAERRAQGAHYTSEKNILKVITSLFLDDLHAEFERMKNSSKQLEQFHTRLAALTFLDPACGSGNFLIIAYRELRRLEIEVLKQKFRHVDGERSLQRVLDVQQLTRLSVEQFYGIELDEFAARVAEVALWMIDHQMNNELGETFGSYFRRLPLRQSPHITQGNALRLDWAALVPPDKLSFILGNPPFVGSKIMNAEQRADIAPVFEGIKGGGVLDYVAAWFVKASTFIRGTDIRCAFVSTNSITQGEQVSILWGHLLGQGLHIQFAHRTFKWANEARGVAAVYCVVVGFGREALERRRLYDYETPTSEATLLEVPVINPYLVAGEPVFISKRQTPLGNVPPMAFGNMSLDGGYLLLSEEEYDEITNIDKNSKKWIKRIMGAKEFINNEMRYCLWLEGVSPKELKEMPEVYKKVKAVKEFREASVAPSTRKFAATPYLFRDLNQPKSDYIFIPRVSSENRKYIPISIVSEAIIVHDSALSIDSTSLYVFGHLTSAMHMAWVRYVCGRLESRYRYSKDVVYNNYPWPQAPTAAQVAKVEQCAQAVLDARAAHPTATLADLYDPLAMPPDLRAAHTALDRAVDQCYRKEKFTTELERIQFLFELYRQYTAPLLPAEPPVKPKPKRARQPKA
jgi:hypothetical protein